MSRDFTSTEEKVLATLGTIAGNLVELTTAVKELITITKKRQASQKDVKEAFVEFADEMKLKLKEILTPQPLPESTYRQPLPTIRIKHQVRVLHLSDYIHNQTELETDLNKLVQGEDYILGGITDRLILLHKMVEAKEEEIDAEFGDVKIEIQ